MAIIESVDQGLIILKPFLIAASISALALQAGSARAEGPSLTLDLSTDSASAEQAVQPLRGKDAYRAFFGALRAANWSEAKTRALSLDRDDPVRA
ncbi:MAG: hypothetical protein B7Z07_03390, partial [Sphingomonadales bacterium 32-67-7]